MSELEIDEAGVREAVNGMVTAVAADPDVTVAQLTEELLISLDDRCRSAGRQLLMLATSYATALKMLAVAQRNSTTEGEKEL